MLRVALLTLLLASALLVLFLVSVPALAEPHTLAWAVAVRNKNKEVQTTVLPESTKFPDKEACDAFGKTMIPRMEDWIRGVLKADWNFPVAVYYACKPSGDPA